MGRTLPTAVMLLEQERARWRKFRRALRKEDQAVLDELLADASRHRQAQAYSSWATPYEAILVAMLLEERKQRKRLAQEVAWLHEHLQRAGIIPARGQEDEGRVTGP